MTASEIIEKIRPLGKEGYKKVIMKHGIREPVFGVSVEELKKIQKVVKKDYQLALDLYATGIYDAMYLAMLIADDMQMTKADLQLWVEQAYCPGLNTNVVPWVAAQGRYGFEMARLWVDSDVDTTAIAGWATWSSLIAMKDDSELDMQELKGLLERVRTQIHTSANRVRSTMNNFVITVGTYVGELNALALKVAEEIGEVTVDMGDTSCKVPFAPERIRKYAPGGVVAKKKKTVKC